MYGNIAQGQVLIKPFTITLMKKERHPLHWAVEQLYKGKAVTSDTLLPDTGSLRIGIPRDGGEECLIREDGIPVYFHLGSNDNADWYLAPEQEIKPDNVAFIMVKVSNLYKKDKDEALEIIQERIGTDVAIKGSIHPVVVRPDNNNVTSLPEPVTKQS